MNCRHNKYIDQHLFLSRLLELSRTCTKLKRDPTAHSLGTDRGDVLISADINAVFFWDEMLPELLHSLSAGQ